MIKLKKCPKGSRKNPKRNNDCIDAEGNVVPRPNQLKTHEWDTHLGIFMLVHAKFSMDSDRQPFITNNYPQGVEIIKQNLGAYGCVSFPYYKSHANINNYVDKLSKKSIYFDTTCENPDDYLMYANNQVKFPMNTKWIPLHKQEGTCKQFQGITKFYQKDYSTDKLYKYIIFTKHVNHVLIHINILDCTEDELFHFFKSNVNRDLRNKCKRFIQNRNHITTHTIFNLIQLASRQLGINKAYIIDHSCNVIPPRHFDTRVKCNGYVVDDTCLDEDLGFGGKI